MSDKLFKINTLYILTTGFLLLFASAGVSAQPVAKADGFLQKKSIRAIKISVPPKIDGVLDEHFWGEMPVARDFVVYSPFNGTRPDYSTEVRFAYDDEALYAGAVMFDPRPDSICRELGKRDQVEALITDYISIDLLPYNDGLNMYEFKITPANLQNDCKYSAIGQDINWDAVWESAARINDSSWVAEVKIPFSALRFPKTEVQTWGINMWRNLMRKREWSTWTFVDIKDQDIFKNYGTLEGLKNIVPPLRLSFTPYLAGYLDKSPQKPSWQRSLRGGMDLRLGLNQSFTLDMMVIPDFGQVQSDDIILNLSPFEVRYDEKRQFFSEGTELFNKCGIFYSRRVGSIPRKYYDPYYEAQLNREVVTENPSETRIINATKISGRTNKGLGIGFFNAMTAESRAELYDSVKNSNRFYKTQPFTNYNVLVLDQNLKNNSYATIINTHYWIPGDHYMANVTGLETRLNNKSRYLAFFGQLNYSQVNDPDNPKKEKGYQYVASLMKLRGNFQFEMNRTALNSTYNPNDMGYITNNNEARNYIRLSHILFDPYWKFQSAQSDFYVHMNNLYNEKELITVKLQADNLTTFRNYWANYLEWVFYPKGYNDFYEPRTWGWKYHKPAYADYNWRIASDARKAFRIHNSIGFSHASQNSNNSWFIETTGRMRFSNRFTISLQVTYSQNFNDYGWVNTEYDSLFNPVIYFGRRDVTTISNILNVKYIFSTKTSLNLRGRHYWSRADYHDYYRLMDDGSLHKEDYDYNSSLSFNVFTADLQFVWYFAPGSELSVVWKNYINTVDDRLHVSYADDFRNTVSAPQSNSFSVRVIYYLDYLNLKKIMRPSIH